MVILPPALASARLTCRDAEPLLLPGDAWPWDTRGLARQQHLRPHHSPNRARQWLHHRGGCKETGSRGPCGWLHTQAPLPRGPLREKSPKETGVPETWARKRPVGPRRRVRPEAGLGPLFSPPSPAPPASSSAPAPCPTGLGCLARRAGGPTLHSEGHVFVGHACRVAGCADVAASVDGEDLPDLQGACGWSGARRGVRGPGDRDGASWALTRLHPGIPGPGPSACLLPVCKQCGGTWVLGRPCSPPRA